MTQSGAANVAAIIVNYNTASLTLTAVESVLTRVRGGRAIEVHIVDNASPAGDGSFLAEELKSRGWDRLIDLHRETENHGFGGGNNVVLHELASRAAPPSYVFLLNPDARLENDAIEILADFLDTHPEIAVAGARIEKPGNVPVTAAFRFPGIASTFSSALAFGPVSRLLSQWEVPLSPSIPSGPVDWVAGAAVMMRLEAVKAAGFFDPSYFLYYEEVDLMRQIQRQGGQVWYVAEAHVIHDEGAATKVRSGEVERRRRPAYWYRSWRHYFRKNHGRFGAMVAATAWLAGAACNEGLSRVRGRAPSAPLFFFQDFAALVVRPLFGLKERAYE